MAPFTFSWWKSSERFPILNKLQQKTEYVLEKSSDGFWWHVKVVTSSVLLATHVQQQSKRLSCHPTVPQRATNGIGLDFPWKKRCPHRTHLWYTYLHLVDFYDKCIYKCSKYTRHGSVMGSGLSVLFLVITSVFLDNESWPGMNEISYTRASPHNNKSVILYNC